MEVLAASNEQVQLTAGPQLTLKTLARQEHER
jgi:hypothetical protein